jgi:hypothetical protein
VRLATITILLLAVAAAAQTTAPGSGTNSPPSAATKPGATHAPHQPAAAAPAVDEGRLNGNLYTNQFFHFSFALPSGFEVDEEFMEGTEDESHATFVLLAAYGPAQSDGRSVLVLMADKVPGTALSAGAFLEKVTREYAQKHGFEVLDPGHEVLLGGRKFLRADYRKEGRSQSAVFTLLRGYAVGFSLAAPDAAAMAQLNQSLAGLKFAPAQSKSTPRAQAPSQP